MFPSEREWRLTLPPDCAAIFAQHFCNRLGAAYISLRNVLDESNPDHAEVLNSIKIRFREETFTREGIAECVKAYPELVRLLYVAFAMVHYPGVEQGMNDGIV